MIVESWDLSAKLTIFLAFFYLLLTPLLWWLSPTVAFWWSIGAVIPLAYLCVAIYYFWRSTPRHILRGIRLKPIQALGENLPHYKFPDYFLAIEALTKQHRLIRKIEKSHFQNLNYLLRYDIDDLTDWTGEPIDYVTFETGYKQEAQLPDDGFWVIEYQPQNQAFKNQKFHVCVRLRYNRQFRFGFLEIASVDVGLCKEIKKWITDYAQHNSIYRGKLFSINIIENKAPKRGNEEVPPQFQFVFKQPENITKDDIVLDEQHQLMLERNVLKFYEHKQDLLSLGISGQKGLLLYGASGTGKTYTCQYLYSQMKNTTVILLTGKHLAEMKTIWQIAKSLQPSLVILEDIDWVFVNRDNNSFLLDLLDELDSLKSEDNLIFLMTTNSIERIESVIRDRPGRINQCIKFDYPKDDLRKRYFEHFLKPYDSSEIDLQALVQLTGRVSQVFIKELVAHAVHIAYEKADFQKDQFKLRTAHFIEAFEELTSQNNRYVDSILGFR